MCSHRWIRRIRNQFIIVIVVVAAVIVVVIIITPCFKCRVLCARISFHLQHILCLLQRLPCVARVNKHDADTAACNVFPVAVSLRYTRLNKLQCLRTLSLATYSLLQHTFSACFTRLARLWPSTMPLTVYLPVVMHYATHGLPPCCNALCHSQCRTLLQCNMPLSVYPCCNALCHSQFTSLLQCAVPFSVCHSCNALCHAVYFHVAMFHSCVSPCCRALCHSQFISPLQCTMPLATYLPVAVHYSTHNIYPDCKVLCHSQRIRRCNPLYYSQHMPLLQCKSLATYSLLQCKPLATYPLLQCARQLPTYSLLQCTIPLATHASAAMQYTTPNVSSVAMHYTTGNVCPCCSAVSTRSDIEQRVDLVS